MERDTQATKYPAEPDHIPRHFRNSHKYRTSLPGVAPQHLIYYGVPFVNILRKGASRLAMLTEIDSNSAIAVAHRNLPFRGSRIDRLQVERRVPRGRKIRCVGCTRDLRELRGSEQTRRGAGAYSRREMESHCVQR